MVLEHQPAALKFKAGVMGETKPHRRPLFSFYLKQIDSKILQVFLKSKTTGFPVIFSFFFSERTIDF